MAHPQWEALPEYVHTMAAKHCNTLQDMQANARACVEKRGAFTYTMDVVVEATQQALMFNTSVATMLAAVDNLTWWQVLRHRVCDAAVMDNPVVGGCSHVCGPVPSFVLSDGHNVECLDNTRRSRCSRLAILIALHIMNNDT